MRKMGKRIAFACILAILFMALGSSGCTPALKTPPPSEKVPTLKIKYDRTICHTPMQVLVEKGEEFRDWGSYLKPIIPGEKYDLISQGQKVAEVLVVKDPRPAVELMDKGEVDVALGCIVTHLSGIDKGVPLKIISPLCGCNFALVIHRDHGMNSWKDFLEKVPLRDKPLKIVASRAWTSTLTFDMIFTQKGLRTTWDPEEHQADIIWVDLKPQEDPLKLLEEKRVDGIATGKVEAYEAERRGLGVIIAQVLDMGSGVDWRDYPCCTISATETAIKHKKEALQLFLNLWHKSANWCKLHPQETHTLAAKWLGFPEHSVSRAEQNVIAHHTPTPAWMQATAIYVEELNKRNLFQGKLKGKTLEEVKGEVFDFHLLEALK